MCFRENFGHVTPLEMQMILSYLQGKSYPYEKTLELMQTIDGVQQSGEQQYSASLEAVWDRLMSIPAWAAFIKEKQIETHYELLLEAIEHYEEGD